MVFLSPSTDASLISLSISIPSPDSLTSFTRESGTNFSSESQVITRPSEVLATVLSEPLMPSVNSSPGLSSGISILPRSIGVSISLSPRSIRPRPILFSSSSSTELGPLPIFGLLGADGASGLSGLSSSISSESILPLLLPLILSGSPGPKVGLRSPVNWEKLGADQVRRIALNKINLILI